jgi:uncharacterized protein (TIGR02145 family)
VPELFVNSYRFSPAQKNQIMKALITIIPVLFCLLMNAQEEKLEVAGAIQISNNDDPSPDPGTIRWTGTDFEGWNGSKWVSLTAGVQFIRDIDNNRYEIVTIGTQTWMAENLRVTRYNDGTAIPLVEDNTAWSNLTSGAYCWPAGSKTNEFPYGKLYNGYVVDTTLNGNKNVCPSGWHVPSDGEWTTLTNFLGSTVAGGRLKEVGFVHWADPNTGAINDTGFTALPGGFRSDDTGTFHFFGSQGNYATSTDIMGNGSRRILNTGQEHVVSGIHEKKLGFSIRCVRD